MNPGKILFKSCTIPVQARGSGFKQEYCRIQTEFFQDSISALVFLTHSSYASPLVSFLVREISEEMGMTNLSVDGSNVRHLELNGAHVIVKNVGSLVYLFISNDLNEAEKLIGSILPVP